MFFTFMAMTITFLQKRETVLETDLNRIETALKIKYGGSSSFFHHFKMSKRENLAGLLGATSEETRPIL